jgi:MFS family permease
MARNPALFIAFRVLFNARFYYPVLAVFFVDLGLSLERYALLNVAWALSIVLLELPLGALGDQIGRRPLVIGAAAIMVVEMGVLSFFDSANPDWLFAIFLINRVLSGAAEAAASGADEALAYDSLVEEGRVGEWPDVLARLGRSMAIAMSIAMIVGGLVYDAGLMGRAAGALGLDVDLDQRTTARFPVYLCLAMSFGALLTAIRMKEPTVGRRPAGENAGLRETFRGIATATGWVLRTPFALGVVLFYLALDSIVRLFLTVTSTFFRMLEIEPRWFGVISAGFSLVGFATPTLAKLLIRRTPAGGSFTIAAVIILAGLAGVATVRGFAGILVVLPVAVGFHLVGFLTSHHLNAVTASERRATVLSIKSLAGNLAYGIVGWLFAVLLKQLAGGTTPTPGSPEEADAFSRALAWIPSVFAVVMVLLFLWSTRVSAMRRWPRRADEPDES